jgi:hypothetical protein
LPLAPAFQHHVFLDFHLPSLADSIVLCINQIERRLATIPRFDRKFPAPASAGQRPFSILGTLPRHHHLFKYHHLPRHLPRHHHYQLLLVEPHHRSFIGFYSTRIVVLPPSYSRRFHTAPSSDASSTHCHHHHHIHTRSSRCSCLFNSLYCFFSILVGTCHLLVVFISNSLPSSALFYCCLTVFPYDYCRPRSI